MFKRKKKAKSPDNTFLVISSLTRRCNHSSSQTPKASCPCRARRGAAAAGLAGPTAQSSAGDSRAPLRDCAPAEQSALHGHRSPFAQGWSHCCDGTPWLGLQEKNHCLVPKPGCRYQTELKARRPAVVDLKRLYLTMYFGCITLSRYPPEDEVSDRFSWRGLCFFFNLIRDFWPKKSAVVSLLFKMQLFFTKRHSCGQIPTELPFAMSQYVFSFKYIIFIQPLKYQTLEFRSFSSQLKIKVFWNNEFKFKEFSYQND